MRLSDSEKSIIHMAVTAFKNKIVLTRKEEKDKSRKKKLKKIISECSDLMEKMK